MIYLQIKTLVSKSSDLGKGNSSLRRKLAALEELYAALAKRSHASQGVVQELVSIELLKY